MVILSDDGQHCKNTLTDYCYDIGRIRGFSICERYQICCQINNEHDDLVTRYCCEGGKRRCHEQGDAVCEQRSDYAIKHQNDPLKWRKEVSESSQSGKGQAYEETQPVELIAAERKYNNDNSRQYDTEYGIKQQMAEPESDGVRQTV
jgi:hypothetical protein